jgi:hypothetical protein
VLYVFLIDGGRRGRERKRKRERERKVRERKGYVK